MASYGSITTILCTASGIQFFKTRKEKKQDFLTKNPIKQKYTIETDLQIHAILSLEGEKSKITVITVFRK